MNRSGLPALVRGVREKFVAWDVSAAVHLGWRQRNQQINQGPGGANRVVFQPGDTGGRAGVFSAARNANDYNPRALCTWDRLVLVSVWAVDPAKPQDDEAALEAVETLLEHTVQAVQATAAANASWGALSWTTSPVELAFGRELLVELVLRGPIFDRPAEVVIPTPRLNRNPAT